MGQLCQMAQRHHELLIDLGSGKEGQLGFLMMSPSLVMMNQSLELQETKILSPARQEKTNLSQVRLERSQSRERQEKMSQSQGLRVMKLQERQEQKSQEHQEQRNLEHPEQRNLEHPEQRSLERLEQRNQIREQRARRSLSQAHPEQTLNQEHLEMKSLESRVQQSSQRRV